MALSVALIALLIEAAAGYPERLYRRIGHPVTWIGRLIATMEARWNRAEATPCTRRQRGRALVAVLLGVSLLTGAVLWAVAPAGLAGVLMLGLVASSLIAQRSLHAHVAAVADALERGGLDAGRDAVSHIVGRDPDTLDTAGVARAAIESLAENFSDGVAAPVLWLAALGPAGGLAYKAINTADSMIGHRTERHIDFGRAAARLDDWVNWPAARVSAGLVIAAAALLPGADPRAAWRAVRADARRHRSPNAGWPEAAMAGALGIALAGPRAYGGEMTDDPMMNAGGRRDAGAADIRRALALYRCADALLIALLAVAVGGVSAAWGATT